MSGRKQKNRVLISTTAALLACDDAEPALAQSLSKNFDYVW